MARLDFDAVTKTYPGPVTALAGFTLSAADRELVVLVGPSGAGKTTALRIAAGLERTTSGSIRMDGRTIDGLRPKDRDMAMVFQQPALYPHLTVRENASFSLRMRATPRDEVQRRVTKTAADLGIADLLDRYPHTLSGGQAQRAALARALVRRPGCLLLDEPFASLDAPLRTELRREFRASHRREPVTTLFVTHDQDEALALADRLVILRGGRIEQMGTPQQLYDEPANRFVAGFLGSPPMNFLPGKLIQEQCGISFTHPDIRLPIAESMHSRLVEHTGRDLVIGFRPNDVRVAAHDPASADAPLAGTVTDYEFQGDRWLVCLRTQRGAEIRSVTSGAAPPTIGAEYSLHINSQRLHFFTADEPGPRL